MSDPSDWELWEEVAKDWTGEEVVLKVKEVHPSLVVELAVDSPISTDPRVLWLRDLGNHGGPTLSVPWDSELFYEFQCLL